MALQVYQVIIVSEVNKSCKYVPSRCRRFQLKELLELWSDIVHYILSGIHSEFQAIVIFKLRTKLEVLFKLQNVCASPRA